jgi:hypothetical protein
MSARYLMLTSERGAALTAVASASGYPTQSPPSRRNVACVAARIGVTAFPATPRVTRLSRCVGLGTPLRPFPTACLLRTPMLFSGNDGYIALTSDDQAGGLVDGDVQ